MTQQKYKKAADVLISEKNSIDRKLTEINDRRVVLQTQLQELRNNQFGYREAKEILSPTAMNKAARLVLDNQISAAQIEIEKVLKDLDTVEKDHEIWYSKSKGMEKSIREIQTA
jgi:hypothetical protein